jgi:hypothetical protein
LVSQTKTTSTLTTGKVSSHKIDSGGHQLIETDTEIGHGNSGGPAYNDDGYVVGIATYSAGGGEGDGTLNYIRDIADFKNVAAQSSVNYAESRTQTEWDKGIQLFYQAHYKSAVAHFARVQKLYPNHPTAKQLTATADKRIANGENIDEFPVLLVVILGIIILAGAAGSVVFIVMHKQKHNALVQAVATGQATPPVPGAPVQFVPPAMPTQQFIAQAPQQFAQVPQPFAVPEQAPVPLTQQPVVVQAPQPQPVQQPEPQQPQQPVQQPQVSPGFQSLEQPNDGTQNPFNIP